MTTTTMMIDQSLLEYGNDTGNFCRNTPAGPASAHRSADFNLPFRLAQSDRCISCQIRRGLVASLV
jgi:hypothetical protein